MITKAPSRSAHPAEIVALQVFILTVLLIRLYYEIWADPLGDEAYYWMWGQRLSWSYFDHPPLQAWLLRLVSMVFGWNNFAVRVLEWGTFGGTLLIFRDWVRRLRPADPKLWFWRTTAIYLGSPMYFTFGTMAYHDHLLVFCSLLAIHCFVVFTDKFESGQPRALLWLYFAAIGLGLAALSKYNGMFVGLGFLAAFLIRPKLRALFATPHPWLAALLAIAMQAPVVYWNLTEGMASFRFHLDDRWGGAAWQFNYIHPINFLIVTTATAGPFLVWPMIRLIRSKPLTDFEARARSLTIATFAISTLSLFGVAFFLDAYFYWNIVAYIGLFPLLTRFLQNRVLLWWHLMFGLICAAAVVFNYGVVPIGVLMDKWDGASSINFGWTEIAEHMHAAEAKQPAGMIAGTRYSTTSQLGFAMRTSAAVKLSPEHSQYDYWQNDADYAGKSALILTDEPDDSGVLTFLRQHFATLTQVDDFPIERWGHTIYHWRIWRGDSYKPSP